MRAGILSIWVVSLACALPCPAKTVKGKGGKNPGKTKVRRQTPTAHPPDLSNLVIPNYPDYETWLKIWAAVDALPPEPGRGSYLLPSGTIHMYACSKPPTAQQTASTLPCYNDGPVTDIDPALGSLVRISPEQRLAILQFLALRYGLISDPSNLTKSQFSDGSTGGGSANGANIVNGVAACVRIRLNLLITRVASDTGSRYASGANLVKESNIFGSLVMAMYVQRHLKLFTYLFPDALVFGYFLQFTNVDGTCTASGFSRY